MDKINSCRISLFTDLFSTTSDLGIIRNTVAKPLVTNLIVAYGFNYSR